MNIKKIKAFVDLSALCKPRSWKALQILSIIGMASIICYNFLNNNKYRTFARLKSKLDNGYNPTVLPCIGNKLPSKWREFSNVKHWPPQVSLKSHTPNERLYDTWELMAGKASFSCDLIRLMGNGESGRDGQGPYRLCFDKPFRPIPGHCLVYSFGISNDWSFDDEISAFGCEVYSFDPSIGLQEHKRKEGPKFYPFGLSSHVEINSKGWQMKTLSSIVSFLKHDNRWIDVLKIDVEGDEVKSILQMISDGSLQNNVKVLLIEWHPGTYTSTLLDEVLTAYHRLQNLAGFEKFYIEQRFLAGYFFTVESYVNANV